MSSDISSQSPDTNKLNQSSYTSPSMQSSCDPISLWGSCRSSEVSSVELLSPSKAALKKSTNTDANLTIPMKIIPIKPVSKCEENQDVSPLNVQKEPPPPYFEHNFKNEIKISPEYSEMGVRDPTVTDDTEELVSLANEAEYFQPQAECSNQNTDWNQNNVDEKDLHFNKDDTDSISLSCNKELILPDDVVSYINEVSGKEVDDKSFLQNQNTIQTSIKTDCCDGCGADPQESESFQNSFSSQSNISTLNNIYQNGVTQNHGNSNVVHQSLQDIKRISCNDTQNNSYTNTNTYEPNQNNGYKNEYIPQSCNQGTSQPIFNNCNQQTWNTQNIQQPVSYQDQFCSTRAVNPVQFHCNQQLYNNPPTYQAATQYNVNNSQIQSQVLDNRCHMTNCGPSQTMNMSPVYCNHQSIPQFSNQQPVNQITVHQFSNQHSANQLPVHQFSNQQSINQLPVNQFSNQQPANQLLVHQFSNQQATNQLSIHQFSNHQPTNQLPIHQFSNQQPANQLPVNQFSNQLSANQLSVHQFSNQMPANQPVHQFSNQQSANQHLDHQFSNQPSSNYQQVHHFSNQQLANHQPLQQFSNQQPTSLQPVQQFSNQQNTNVQPIQQFSNHKCLTQMCVDTCNNMQPQCNTVTQSYNGLYQQGLQPQNTNCYHQYQQCANCGSAQNFSNNYGYTNNARQQSVSPQQFVPSGPTVQCATQQAIPSPTVNNSSEISSPKAEKPKFEKQTFHPPKTEPQTVSCSNNVPRDSAERNTTMSIQSNGVQNSSSQTVSTGQNTTIPSASSILPTSNMVINDMNSILSSLIEETKYLKLLK